jgi:hypothetical protein
MVGREGGMRGSWNGGLWGEVLEWKEKETRNNNNNNCTQLIDFRTTALVRGSFWCI